MNMELWIRSQDKIKLVKCEGLSLAYRKDKITTDINVEYKEYLETIGTYKSKERALEVLDEIQKILTLNTEYQGSYQWMDIQVKGVMARGVMGYVYVMPKK